MNSFASISVDGGGEAARIVRLLSEKCNSLAHRLRQVELELITARQAPHSSTELPVDKVSVLLIMFPDKQRHSSDS